MTNKKYNAGRKFEYRTKYYLEDKGFFVVRSAGSKGEADLVAIRPYGLCSEVLLVQCKYGLGHISNAEIIKLISVSDKVNAIPILVTNDDKHKLVFKNLKRDEIIEIK
jgi:Holliday junction resolvase